MNQSQVLRRVEQGLTTVTDEQALRVVLGDDADLFDAILERVEDGTTTFHDAEALRAFFQERPQLVSKKCEV